MARGRKPKFISAEDDATEKSGESVIVLHPKQKEFTSSEAIYRGFVAGISSGKALALDTPIPTPSGWTTMGEIQVGDIVFNEHGNQCEVVFATDVMYDHHCYELRFSDGTKVVADADHLWNTVTFSERKAARRRVGGGDPRRWQCLPRTYSPTHTTKEIYQTTSVREAANHAVKVCDPIACSDATLPIPPYTLGVWLGDGTSTSAIITCDDYEIVEFIEQDGFSLKKLDSKSCGTACQYAIHVAGLETMPRDKATGRFYSHPDKLLCKLRALGLTGRRSVNKTIPSVYQRASESQRLLLLYGLMDTDGCVDKAGHCEFTSTSEKLARSVLELLRGLGFKPTLSEGRATLYGKDCGPKYRIYFFPDRQVFRIPRKAIRVKVKRKARSDYRYIKSVTPVPSVPVRCISVNSKSHLYLCSEAFIPTHNTYCGAYDLLKRSRPKCLYMIISATYRMLEDSTKRVFIKMAEDFGLWDDKKYKRTDNQAILNNGAEILFRSGDEPGRLRGPSLSGCWMDECSQMKEEAFNVLIGRLREGGKQGWLTGTFTPCGKDHWTYQVFGDKSDDNVRLFHCSTRDNPFVEPKFYENLLLRYGKSEAGMLRAQQELEGEFVVVEGAEWGPEHFNGANIWFDNWPSDSNAIRIAALDSSKGVGGKSGDYSAFVKIMVSGGKIWVDADLDNTRNSSVMAATAMEIQKSFQPDCFGIEAEFGGNVLVDDLAQRAEIEDIPINLALVPTNGVPKEVRIRRLTRFIVTNKFRFRNNESTRILVHQAESFPHSAHDDGIDALEMAVRIAVEGGAFGQEID